MKRLLRKGFHAVPAPSLERQLEVVHRELGQLPDGDAEREHLARLLSAVLSMTPLSIATALLELGELLETESVPFAAEEYFLSGFEVAGASRLAPEKIIALRRLGRLARHGGRWTEAEQRFQRAAELSLEHGDQAQWARALEGLAGVHIEQGRLTSARTLLRSVMSRADEQRDNAMAASAGLVMARVDLAAGDCEGALDKAWTAFGLAADDANRERILATLGEALARLRFFPAADRCYQILARRAQEEVARAGALATQAAIAAEAGDAPLFRARRQDLLRGVTGRLDARAAAARVHLELGRGAFLVGDIDFARDHLREAIIVARARGDARIMIRAESLLSAIEEESPVRLAARPGDPPPIGERTRRIAAAVESFDEALVPATG